MTESLASFSTMVTMEPHSMSRDCVSSALCSTLGGMQHVILTSSSSLGTATSRALYILGIVSSHSYLTSCQIEDTVNRGCMEGSVNLLVTEFNLQGPLVPDVYRLQRSQTPSRMAPVALLEPGSAFLEAGEDQRAFSWVLSLWREGVEERAWLAF